MFIVWVCVLPIIACVAMNTPFPSVHSGYFWSFYSFVPVSIPYFLLPYLRLKFYISICFLPKTLPPTSFLLQTFDKCFLGSSETADVNRVFCGQMGAVYLFGEALSAAQILAIYQLGPGYQVGINPEMAV